MSQHISEILRPIEERVYATVQKGESMTQQHHAEACDINTILERYQATGVIEHVNRNQPQYGVVTGHDFKEAMDIVASAQSSFAELPARAREYFNHDPAQFLDYVEKDPNLDVLDDLNLTDRVKRDARRQIHHDRKAGNQQKLPVQPDQEDSSPVQPAPEAPVTT